MDSQVSPWVNLLFAVSQLAFLATAVVVGMRLLLLARKTRALPELLLGSSFVLGTGFGYIGLVAGMISLGTSETDADAAAAARVIAFGWGMINVGMMLTLGFTYCVYRRGQRWARVFVAGLYVLLWVGLVGRASGGQLAQQDQFDGVWYFVHQGTILTGISWALVEATRYYGLMKRRLALGLADPIVTNRFLLWGAGSGCGVGISLLGSSPCLFPLLDPAMLPLVSSFMMISMATLGIVEVGFFWLTFFPFARYRRWVVERHAACA